MKICSVTITPNEEMDFHIPAIDSATSIVDEDVLYEAGEITDFSMVRNAALELASYRGCDWALMLDTDERIHITEDIPGPAGNALFWLQGSLIDTPHDMLHVWDEGHTYQKPRLFRLPARGHYKGPTHECWVNDPTSTSGNLEGITFSELPKTEAQFRAKLERDRDILVPYVKEHPDDPRWWFYLGQTYEGLGDHQEAVTCWEYCFDCDGWDEESAWAAYKIASAYSMWAEHDTALEWCAKGMTRHPGMAELPWLAGYCCYQMGRYQHAIYWENMAAALNAMGADEPRINFRHAPALEEGPFDVLRWAHRALGEEEDADLYEEAFANQLEHRTGQKSGDLARENLT